MTARAGHAEGKLGLPRARFLGSMSSVQDLALIQEANKAGLA